MHMGMLEGKVAVVYGGGGVIGSASALVFAREGARVHVAGRTSGPLDSTLARVRDIGATAYRAIVDARDPQRVQEHLADVSAREGAVDLVLNAVGFDHVQGPLIEETSLPDFLHPVTAFLTTNFATARAAAPIMKSRGHGVILGVSTPGARLAGPGLIGNAAQSAGLEGFLRALAGELGPHGIRVVCVRPHALAETDARSYTARMFSRVAARHGMQRDEWLRAAAAGTLLGRLPTPADVAEFLAYAASDRAPAMTGVVGNLSAGAILD